MEPGTYWGQLKSAVTCSAQTGTPQVVLTFEITHRGAAGYEWDALNQSEERKVFLSLTDKAWPYSQAKLEALGFNGSFKVPRFSSETTEKGVALDCRLEEYEGRRRERWDLLDWGGAREHEPASDDVLRRLGALWKAKAKQPSASAKANEPVAALPSEAGSGPPRVDEHGVPF